MSPTTRTLALLALAGCTADPAALLEAPAGDRALPGVPAPEAARDAAPETMVGTSPDQSWAGASSSAFGYGVSGVGDLNGDGYDDIAVGANRESSYAGAMYVYLGSPSGPSATPDHSYAGAANEQMGRIPVAGDFNADGFSDLVVGASFANSRRGRADIYLGSSAGLDATPDQSLQGTTTSSYVGIGMAVGDFDADGYDDLVLGEYARNRIQIYAGGASGVATSPATTLSGPGGNSYFGQYTGIGDINADGYDDLVSVDYGWGSLKGKAWLFLGSSTGLSTTSSWSLEGASTSSWLAEVDAGGDLNGDGIDDFVIGSRDASGTVQIFFGASAGPATTADITLTGVGAGWPVPRIVADMDLDGYDDLVIGDGGGSAGQAAVYRGGPAGPSTTADQTLAGPTTNGGFGQDLRSAGDVDGDGVPDLIIGEWQADAAHLFLGEADADADGIPAGEDCDDTDPDIGDPVDAFLDMDGDGWGHEPITACPGDEGVVDRDGDCDDSDAEIAPQVEERPGDGIDQDCDGLELCFQDRDGDGVRTEHTVDSPDLACDGEGEASIDDLDGDCDDDDASVFPGAEDLPDDGIDQDCDGADSADETPTDDTGEPSGDTGDTGWDTGEADDDTDGDAKPSCSVVPGASLGAGLLAGLVALARRRED